MTTDRIKFFRKLLLDKLAELGALEAKYKAYTILELMDGVKTDRAKLKVEKQGILAELEEIKGLIDELEKEG